MNKAKKAAAIDGKEFLKSAYAAEQTVLSVKFDFSESYLKSLADFIKEELNKI
jgi:hypothetical protein